MERNNDVGSRWIVCRPRGGLNDTLCQLEMGLRFAQRTGRKITIDSLNSGLLLPFDDVFSFVDKDSGKSYASLSEGLAEFLNGLTAFPSDTTGKVLAYDRIKDSSDEFYTQPSNQPLKFPLTRDYPEPVVVYEAMGGGVLSHCFLQRVALHTSFVADVQAALQDFPNHYASVHVRQSDLSTDYEQLLGSVKERIAGMPVFVASDSGEVIDYARTIFKREQLLTLSTATSRDGQPLHTPTRELSLDERRQLTKELLIELFAIAHSNQFFFGDVTNRSGISGFSRLAAFLVKTPKVRRQLLGSPNAQQEIRPGQTHHVASMSSQFSEKTRWLFQKSCR